MERIILPENLTGKKIISFSLYGNDPMYTIGAIKNTKLAKIHFPDWVVVIFHDNSVSQEILNELELLDTTLISVTWGQDLGRFWRFILASENIECFISRDTDSRLFERDKVAVDEWINSGKKFHIIREHPVGHNWSMNAGMWGSLGNSIPNIQEEIFKYYKKLNFRLHKFSDQYFLGEVIYPLTLDESLSHDEFSNYPDKIKTNIKRDRIIDDYSIIGEVFNHEDIPMGDQRSPFRQ